MSTQTPAAPDQTATPDLLSVAMVTLGCARNEVDSEELAGRLEADRVHFLGRGCNHEVYLLFCHREGLGAETI